jgi:hypothetical protein
MTNCTDCMHHHVLPDPDPNDWFCDDDVKVICSHKESLTPKGMRVITCACRPYNIVKECETPDWCPLNNTGG